MVRGALTLKRRNIVLSDSNLFSTRKKHSHTVQREGAFPFSCSALQVCVCASVLKKKCVPFNGNYQAERREGVVRWLKFVGTKEKEKQERKRDTCSVDIIDMPAEEVTAHWCCIDKCSVLILPVLEPKLIRAAAQHTVFRGPQTRTVTNLTHLQRWQRPRPAA